jgi:hypothetical protein
VRPNQGLIKPGEKAEVNIFLVEKDKKSLLQAYERLGQTALDHSKDKFLVQSVAVSDDKAQELQDYDSLTVLWTTVTASDQAVVNKKLPVRHVVAGGTAAPTTSPDLSSPATNASATSPEQLSKEQLVAELKNLRHKYDELVAFSVNLTAERDILNNTLELTKRDLNRELSNKKTSPAAAAQQSSGTGRGSLLLIILLALIVGAWIEFSYSVLESVLKSESRAGSGGNEEL